VRVMRPVAAALVLLAAAAVSACSSVSITTDYDESADFGAVRTFAWMPPAPGEPPAFAGNTIVEKRVTAAVERELGARGLKRDDASPSFLIAVHTLSRDVLNITTWPSWGYGWHGSHTGAWDDHVEVNQYTEGTLVLDFVRPGSEGLLWRGVARSVIDSETGSNEFVNEVIGKLLADFPPGYGAK
jgi:hypothetical protein